MSCRVVCRVDTAQYKRCARCCQVRVNAQAVGTQSDGRATSSVNETALAKNEGVKAKESP